MKNEEKGNLIKAVPSVLPPMILGICLLFTLASCETAGQHGDIESDGGHVEAPAENPTENTAGAVLEELLTGEWEEQEAEDSDLQEAFDFVKSWYDEEGAALAGRPVDETSALLSGGATQVVSGLNIRLDINTGSGVLYRVLVYRDFAGAFSVEAVEAEGEIIYRSE